MSKLWRKQAVSDREAGGKRGQETRLTKQEKANGQQETGVKARDEALLRRTQIAGSHSWPVVARKVGAPDCERDDQRWEECQEDEGGGAGAEAVVDRKDERERLEVRVDDGVDETGVEGREQDRRVEYVDLLRLDEREPCHRSGLRPGLFDLQLGLEVHVACSFANMTSPTQKDGGLGSFGKYAEQQEKDWTRDPEEFPTAPSPAFVRHCKRGNSRAQRGSE